MIDGGFSAWAQYTIKIKNRDEVQAKLKKSGVPAVVYYPIPLNRQAGYAKYPVVEGGVPASDKLAGQVLSLPMHPYLKEDTQDRIIQAVESLVS